MNQKSPTSTQEFERLAARIDKAVGTRPQLFPGAPIPPSQPPIQPEQWRDTIGNPIDRAAHDVIETIDELITQLESLKQRVQGELRYARDTIDEIARKVAVVVGR